MKADFVTDLSEEQKAEQKAVEEFKALKATKRRSFEGTGRR